MTISRICRPLDKTLGLAGIIRKGRSRPKTAQQLRNNAKNSKERRKRCAHHSCSRLEVAVFYARTAATFVLSMLRAPGAMRRLRIVWMPRSAGRRTQKQRKRSGRGAGEDRQRAVERHDCRSIWHCKMMGFSPSSVGVPSCMRMQHAMVMFPPPL